MTTQKTLKSAWTLFLLFYLASCAPSRPASVNDVPTGLKPRISIADLERNVHDRINQERQRQGLAALAWNSTLSTIARKHSKDMAQRNYFSHYSPDGHNFVYRYQQEGYSCSIQVKNMIYGGAENIFQNNLYDRIVYVNDVPNYDWNSLKKITETTVDGWMNSPGHRKNILTPHWKSEGIGIFIAPDDKIYITENFC